MFMYMCTRVYINISSYITSQLTDKYNYLRAVIFLSSTSLSLFYKFIPYLLCYFLQVHLCTC